jgi:hypothetical protein
VHANLLRYWRRQAERRAVDDCGGLKLLPVTVSGLIGSTSRAGGSIEIELGGAVRIRVDAMVDEAALGRVLRALGR